LERNTIAFEDSLDLAVADNGPDRIVPFTEFYEHKAGQKKLISYTTGLGLLDEYTQGFRPGEVVVLTGPTGNGKTLFAETIGQRLMRSQNMRIAWFSFEVPTEQIITKYVESDDYDKLGLFVPMEMKPGDFEWLKRKCLEAQLKYNVQAVFIDHLHFLVDMVVKSNFSLNIGAVMRRIKHEIAKEMGLIVFLIAHQGQPGDNEPSLDSCRDSSFIGQECDTGIVVFRSPDPLPDELKKNAGIKGYPRTYDGGFATIKIDKARFAGTYRKKITCQKIGQWLEEVGT